MFRSLLKMLIFPEKYKPSFFPFYMIKKTEISFFGNLASILSSFWAKLIYCYVITLGKNGIRMKTISPKSVIFAAFKGKAL